MFTRTEISAVILAAVIALMVATFAVFAGALGFPQAEQGATPGPDCQEWTDGCVICRRTDQGLACSTPGIACTPSRPQCVRP